MKSSPLIKNTTEFCCLLERLKNNPLFYLFNENKENFHSNFWYWMFQINNVATIKILTGDDFQGSEVSNAEFHREKVISHKEEDNSTQARCDVIIEWGDKTYIIETKVKSFPTKEQLIRISRASVYSTSPVFICVHLYPDSTIKELVDDLKNENYEWRFENLLTIANRIIPEVYRDYDLYLRNYQELLTDLSKLFDLFSLDENRYNFTIENAQKQGVPCLQNTSQQKSNVFRALDQLKLWELFLRYRSELFFIGLKEELLKKPEFASEHIDGRIKCDRAIHNKKGTVTFSLFLGSNFKDYNDISSLENALNSKLEGLAVGVQFEGTQMRRFLVSDMSRLKAYEDGGFFKTKLDLIPVELQGLCKDKSGPCQYNKFFRYKYVNLKDNEVDFDSYIQFVLETFEKANRIYDNLTI